MRNNRGPLSEEEKATRARKRRAFFNSHIYRCDDRPRVVNRKYSIEELVVMCKLTIKDGRVG